MKKTVVFIADVMLVSIIIAVLLFCAIPAEERFEGDLGYGLLCDTPTHIAFTARGFDVSNTVLADLIGS
jgi:hypothetical protein